MKDKKMKKGSLDKKGRKRALTLLLPASALLIILSLSVPKAAAAGTYSYIDNTEVVEGTVTGLASNSIEVDGRQYVFAKQYSVLDMNKNSLPRKSLENAQKVRLEVKHGIIETIYILVLPE